MLIIINIYRVNHCTYSKGPTCRRTIVCTKRLVERASAEVKNTMDRLTNLFKHEGGSEVPGLSINQWGVAIYVVITTLIRSKLPTFIKSYTCESPKVFNRQETLELGISRHTKVLGRRRIHSTAFICGKESSFTSSLEHELSGSYESEELKNLLNNVKNDSTCENLSLIMSDPKFLIACWVNIRSKTGSTTPALSLDTLDGIKTNWFYETAKSFRNGNFNFQPARRAYIPKPNGKLRPLTMPSPKDKIVQEGMRLLLEIIFEPTFRSSSHGFRPNRGCESALNSIKMSFGESKWFIEGDIDQQFPTVDHQILIKIIEKRIKDQPFIDLLWKYLRTGYGENFKSVKPMNLGVVQGGNLSPVLSNIYMHPFDVWMEDTLIPSFNKGIRRKSNPEYTKLIRTPKISKKVIFKHNIKPLLWNDSNFKRMKYVRYVDDFLVGVIGSKNECIEIRLKMKEFLERELKMTLNIDKTKITHGSNDSALFLGYCIHITKPRKRPIKYNKKGILTRITPRPQLDGPIDRIVKKLRERGFANTKNNPTRNGKFIALSLADLINHYKTIERGILNYYGFANNYGRVAARVHYILKYSCALTIASKMKLKTLRKVFSKYGGNLNIKDGDGKIIANYPTVSYKRPRKLFISKTLTFDNIIDKLTYRLARGRSDLKGPCTMCGSKDHIEIHHVRKLKPKSLKKDWLNNLMTRMLRKQIPLCRSCHQALHRGTLNEKPKGLY